MSTNALIPHARTELSVSTSQEVTTVIVNLDLRGVTVKQVTLFPKKLHWIKIFSILLKVPAVVTKKNVPSPGFLILQTKRIKFKFRNK